MAQRNLNPLFKAPENVDDQSDAPSHTDYYTRNNPKHGRGLVYPSCVGVLTAIAYFSIVYCFTCMKTHIASEIESGEVVYKEKYRHLMIICGPRYVHQSPCFQPCQIAA
jgi:hypothetical protein